MERYTYLAIDLLSVIFPLLASFEGRLRFWRKWPALFTGILAMSLLFIPWDVAYTARGIWGFNERYLLGITIAGLPLEEWLFFLMIPYACMFLYEVMRHFVPVAGLGRMIRVLLSIIILLLVIIGFLYLDRAYTSLTFIATAAFLVHHLFIVKSRWLGQFFIGYLVSLIPFFVVNGWLTGSWIDEQVVWYDDAENLGIRIGTIPIEDSVYLLLMLLIVTSVYEAMLKRSNV